MTELKIHRMPDSLENWPNCTVPDCSNKACLGLSDTLCYPHATGKPMDRSGNAVPPATQREVRSWQRNLEYKEPQQ